MFGGERGIIVPLVYFFLSFHGRGRGLPEFKGHAGRIFWLWVDPDSMNQLQQGMTILTIGDQHFPLA